jgi:hypothetical protein
MPSQQYAIFAINYYLSITISDGKCDVQLSLWDDEVPTTFPRAEAIPPSAYVEYEIEYNKAENWVTEDPADDSHGSLHWTACQQTGCAEHPDYLKSYQCSKKTLRRTCSFCFEEGHTSAGCEDMQHEGFLTEYEESANYEVCGYCRKKGHLHGKCQKKMAHDYAKLWTH